jgi:hypothetical protein
VKLVEKALTDLNPSEYNPRVELQPGDPEFEKIRSSLEEWDQVEPLIWNEHNGRLIGGHQRRNVMLYLGREKCWVKVVNIKDEEEEKRLNIALNAAQGRWEPAKLEDLLSGMSDAAQAMALMTPDDTDELLRQAEISNSTSFLSGLIHGKGADDPDQPERKREIDLKEEHQHKTGTQVFEVNLVLTGEQRAIYYQAIARGKKKFAGTKPDGDLTTYESLTAILTAFNTAYEKEIE